MENLTHYPVLVFAAAFILLSLASIAGTWLRRRDPNITDEHKDNLSIIVAATLTLLALIIGFSFSMATERYDQRKNFEEAEANAIGTELLRADLLPPDDAARVRKLLGDYLDQRILFYINKDDAERARMQSADQSIAGRTLGSRSWPSPFSANARYSACTCRHERCAQFSGLYSGGILQIVFPLPLGICWPPLPCVAQFCWAMQRGILDGLLLFCRLLSRSRCC